MIQHRASLLVGAALLLVASCNQQSALNSTTPTLPTGMNGPWTGVIDDATLIQVDLYEQPGPVKPGSGFVEPGFVVSGTGFMTRGGCTQSITVSGMGDGVYYDVELTGSGSNAYVIKLFGLFLDDVFDGSFFVESGDPAGACFASGTGLFEMGRTALDGVEGTFTGSWTGADSMSFRTSQTSVVIYGAVRWSNYTCARDAFFYGSRSGDTVVGTLVPLFGSLTSYDISFDWDPDARTLDGSFLVTGVAAGSPCVMGDPGTFQVGSISNAETGAGGSSVSVTVIELAPDSAEPEVLLRYEARD